MKRILSVTIALVLCLNLMAQTISARLSSAYQQFEGDAQLKSALASLYVMDARSGKVVFDKNGSIGLAPASTQKIVTSATAYELLGKDFRYKTELGYFSLANSSNTYNLYIKPSGDPTLGSWRWNATKEANVVNRFVQAASKLNGSTISGMIIDAAGWNSEVIPDGWIWQDIGNYYGAGAGALNWRENQFDLVLRSGSTVGDPVKVVNTTPELHNYQFASMATAAGKGTGDNAYIYFPLSGGKGVVRGTIPVNENHFVISGAMPAPGNQFAYTLADALLQNKVKFTGSNTPITTFDPINIQRTVLYTEYSPMLDSIVYWFNKKSINLYGEALVKTIAYQKKNVGTTDVGVSLIKDFWATNGLDKTELNIVDGSGLSPLNRVTTHAQVTVLHHAKKQEWFPGFFHSLPEYNGMKMKSGTIRGVKGFTGYHKAKDGNEYIFSFLVNNYNGSASAMVQKMYKVLDVLK